MADIILAPYFTKDIKFHQHDSSNKGKGGSLPNSYNQIRSWYESVIKIGAKACIFHNELSDEYISKYQTENIKFVRWSEEHRPSYNDERFYAYLDFLEKNSDISRVMCTDLYDVIFYKNPFELMDIFPQHNIFSGSETTTEYSSKWMIRKCKLMNYPRSRNGFSTQQLIYNAGIVGGKRENILQLFRSIIKNFKRVDLQFNANMPVYNYCLEKLESANILTGFPLHNVFNSNKVLDGTYIKHK